MLEPTTRQAKVQAVVVILCAAWMLLAGGLSRAQAPPTYRVDPFWPKPLPNKWIMQQVPTLAVDKNDHVWVFNRSRNIRPDENGASTNPPRTDCCIAGPSILEFDADGNLLQGWGGPGYVPNWPGEQTVNVDRDGNVWVSGTGRDARRLFELGSKLNQHTFDDLDAERIADHAQIAVRRPEKGQLLVGLFEGNAEVHDAAELQPSRHVRPAGIYEFS